MINIHISVTLSNIQISDVIETDPLLKCGIAVLFRGTACKHNYTSMKICFHNVPQHAGCCPVPVFVLVSGCVNSEPLKTTNNCNSHGGQILSLHGVGWDILCHSEPVLALPDMHQRSAMKFDTASCSKLFNEEYTIRVGSTTCSDVVVASPYVINCTLSQGSGTDLDVVVERAVGKNDRKIVTMLPAALAFRDVVDFRDKFGRFVEYGVGGLKKEIQELYQRAFASRGKAFQGN